MAATNKDITFEMQERRFREDLFFRLNVIPIEVPPLRERLEDIAQLAQQFVTLSAQRLKRPVPRLTEADLLKLQGYHWPGNIRELQNVIERAVILSQANRLSFDLPETVLAKNTPLGRLSASPDTPIVRESDRKQRDRQAIIAALEQSGGKVAGRGGAAEILDLKPTTLASRIKTLGIKKSADP